MGGTSFFIRMCVVLGVFAMTVISQSSDSGRPNSPRKDNEPEKCSCQAEVSVKPNGCNGTTFRQISSELEDTRRQLEAALSADKASISSELEETRHQVEQLQMSVSSSRESVSSELREIRQQLDELKTSVSAVVDVLKDTLPVKDTLPIEEALPINATESTEKASATNNDIFPMDKAHTIDATERSEFIVTTTEADTLDKDCSEILARGVSMSGVYTVQPLDSGEAFQVYCDMEKDGGGWTVFQRRQDGSVDFYLDFANYSRGFGNLEGEFWLGNDNLHRLTAQGDYELHIDLSDFEHGSRYAVYDSFSIADVTDNYRLTLGSYSGTAGDSLSMHNNQQFTTKDRDNDAWVRNCAQKHHGAWWYDRCHYTNLNGEYLRGTTPDPGQGVIWLYWKGDYYSLKTTEMKIRPTPQ